jgi:CRISPR-associated protein Csd2
MSLISKRYDFVFFFDVKDGNPNGDPDAGNLPRIDAETGMGIVTDVCLKRKVRNYVLMTRGAKRPYDIFIKEKAVLNTLIKEALEDKEVSKKEKGDKVESARQWMCKNYYDVRTFGAVMTTGENAGQVRGPVQLTFGRSVESVVALEHSITRVAKTTEERAETGGSEMGRKYTIPYGLYRTHGFVSAHLAAQTGFSQDDLELFWKAMQDMFEHDRSAARGLMSTRTLIIFEHKDALGNKPAHELFSRVTWKRTSVDKKPARDFSDYEILLDGKPLEDLLKVVSVS